LGWDLLQVTEGSTVLGSYWGNLATGSRSFNLTSGAPELLGLTLRTDSSVVYPGIQFDNFVVLGNVSPVPLPGSLLLVGSGLFASGRRLWLARDSERF
jgi:hypothetical protein